MMMHWHATQSLLGRSSTTDLLGRRHGKGRGRGSSEDEDMSAYLAIRFTVPPSEQESFEKRWWVWQ